MNNKYYRPKGPLWFKPHIFDQGELVGIYIWLLFALGTLVGLTLRNDYRISDGMRLLIVFLGAFVLCVCYAVIRIGYYYFKKRFIKPKPEEDEKPIPERIKRMFSVIEALVLMVGLFSFGLGIIAAAWGLLLYLWQFIQYIFKYVS